jgi:hypothetical protein
VNKIWQEMLAFHSHLHAFSLARQNQKLRLNGHTSKKKLQKLSIVWVGKKAMPAAVLVLVLLVVVKSGLQLYLS